MSPTMFVSGAFGPQAPLRPLADGDVRFVGDPIVLVLAQNRYLAEDAGDLVEVDYEVLDPVLDYETAADNPTVVHPELGTNIASTMEAPDPDIQQVFDDAAHVVTETFRQHRYSMVPMETRGVVARYEPFDRQLDVWLSSQNPHEARLVASRITGLPETRVRVQIGDVGGGFGLKSFVGREEQAVMLAAFRLNRTIKWIEDRRENLIASAHARQERVTCTMAVDADGHILGVQLDHADDAGSYAIGGGSAGFFVAMLFPGPYKIPKVSWKATTVYTNTCGRAAYRGPWQMETVAREQMMDAVARQIGIDPFEFRRRNVIRPDELPHATATGVVWENVTPQETLEQAMAGVGYESFRERQTAAARDGRYLGLGIALYIEPQTNVAVFGSEPTNMRIAPDGRVDVYIASGAHGQGLETTTAQLAAEYLGVDIEDVTVHQGDTQSTPYGAGTGGSRSGPMIGAAVQQASAELQAKVFAIAGHLLEAAPEDLAMSDGVISVSGTPGAQVTLAQVAGSAFYDSQALPPELDASLEVSTRFTGPPMVFSNACHACIVEVDAATGRVDIERYIVSEDCGKMINPMIVEGQIAGGVVQGLGGALYEHNIYDADGNPLTSTFLDYLLPTASEAPDIEYLHVESPASVPGSFKGVGEGGAIGAPPAVCNAISDAIWQLGATLNDQPFTSGKVRAAIAAAG
jgi:carbon-monoxide dehydrogenase large subunit